MGNDIDWTKRILCQDDKIKGTLTLNARFESYVKLLNAVQERASLQDWEYINIQKHFSNYMKDKLIENKAKWHCSCHAEATCERNIKCIMPSPLVGTP